MDLEPKKKSGHSNQGLLTDGSIPHKIENRMSNAVMTCRYMSVV